jgi:hypothetical protein
MVSRFQAAAVAFNVSHGKREQNAQFATPAVSTHLRIKHLRLGSFAFLGISVSGVWQVMHGVLIGMYPRIRLAFCLNCSNSSAVMPFRG